jgi:hypothetical protein
MDEEYQSLMQNQTCKLVPRQRWMNVITSKWIYKCKRDENGSIARLKSRLVIQGFKQREGRDYFETFSSVIQRPSVRYPLELAARTRVKVHHIDIKTAFLHADVDSNTFMEQPLGCEDPDFPSDQYACQLRKSLYGLKQAPRLFTRALGESLRKFGLKQCKTDPSIF